MIDEPRETPRTGGDAGYLRIATEEAFAPPELIAQWRDMLARGTIDDPGFLSLWGFYLENRGERARSVVERLQDLGERRLADMDATGIDRQIVSLTSPGTQVFDRDRAVAMATLANDQLAEACRRHPERFTGLTAIAPQDPEAAASEIERGAHDLGFKGVIINSHNHYTYVQTYSDIDTVRRAFAEFQEASSGYGYQCSPSQLGWSVPIHVADTDG